MSCPYTDLLLAIKTRLVTAAYFVGPPAIPVIKADDNDIQTAIDRALGEKGISAVILLTTAKRGKNVRQRQAFIRVEVGENVEVNRAPRGSKKPALDVISEIDGLLDQWAASSVWTRLEFVDLNFVSTGQRVIWEIIFTAQIIMQTV